MVCWKSYTNSCYSAIVQDQVLTELPLELNYVERTVFRKPITNIGNYIKVLMPIIGIEICFLNRLKVA